MDPNLEAIPNKNWWIKSIDIHTCGAIKTCTETQKGVLPVLHVFFILKVTLGYRRRLKTLVSNNRGLRHTKKATSRV
jgi:hypothetical protein